MAGTEIDNLVNKLICARHWASAVNSLLVDAFYSSSKKISAFILFVYFAGRVLISN